MYKIFFSYLPSFIDAEFQKYFIDYTGSWPFVPFIHHEKQFFLMRRQIMDQLTPRQSQVATGAATANSNNDLTDATEPAELKEATKKTEKTRINYLFIIHTKSDSNHSNEICINL